MTPRPLTRAELPVGTVAQARFMLGKLIVRRLPEGLLVGRIVETEAYPPGDAAMHAYRGMTPRNRALFLAPGFAYVYLCYGTSMMLNSAAEPAGTGAAVLYRAVVPLEGVALMMERRRTTRLRDLARGPGRLAQAFAIDRTFDGADLCAGGDLHLATDSMPAPKIAAGVRIGITKDAHRVLRFFVPGNAFVSGPARLNAVDVGTSVAAREAEDVLGEVG